MARASLTNLFIAASLTAGCTTFLYTPSSERWIDEVMLHDGRTIEVERLGFFPSGRGQPNQHDLVANNPDTRVTIRWSGEKNFQPILLDFQDRTAYLAVIATSVFSDLKQYGCPEIPYVFFRYDEKRERWRQVGAREFPSSLLRANLHERSSQGYTARAIPNDFASWQSPYKNQWRVSRYKDGCRHTVPSNEDPSHPQSPGQPSQAVQLEVLASKVYEPDWIIRGDAQIQFRDWTAISVDKERNARCRSLVRQVGDESDKPELRGWLLFVKDPTGTKKARLDSATILCDASALWFVDYGWADPRRVILTKFTHSGDLLYRLNFEKPDAPSGYPGHIMQPTFRSENGYLYFEWWNTDQSGWSRLIKRSMKVRVQEPQPSAQLTTR